MGRKKNRIETALDKRLDALARRRAPARGEAPEERGEAQELERLLIAARLARHALRAELSPSTKAKHLRMLMEAAAAGDKDADTAAGDKDADTEPRQGGSGE